MPDPKVAITISAKDEASKAFKEVGKAGGAAGKFIADNWKGVAVGIAAAGVALEAIARQARDTNVTLEQLAIATDMNADALRQMAIDTSNATFPLKEVTALFQIAGKQGIESAEDMQAFANFWDTIGDATGASSEALAKSAVGLRAVGIAAGEEGEAMTALGFIHTKTNADIGEFLSTLSRLAPDVKKVGLNIDEMAAVMGILEERGISGRAAITELNQAMTTAEGREDFLAGLGMSNEALQAMVVNVGDAEGKIQEMADVIKDNKTFTEEAAAALEVFAAKHAGLLQAAGMLSAPLMAIGMTIGGIGTIATTAAPAIAALGTVIMGTVVPALYSAAAGFVAVQIAGGPILWVIEGIALAIVALGFAWANNWGGIQEKTQAVIEFIKNILVAGWDFVKNLFGVWWDFTLGFYTGIWETVSGAFTAAWDFVKGIFDPVLDFIKDVFGLWWDFTTGFYGGIWDTIKDGLTASWDWIKGIFDAGWKFIKGIWTTAIDWITGIGKAFYDAGVNIVKQLWEGIKKMAYAPIDALKTILQKLRDMIPFSPAKTGPLVGLMEGGQNIIGEVSRGVTDSAPKLLGAMSDIAEKASGIMRSIISPEMTEWLTTRTQPLPARLTGGPSIQAFASGGIVRSPTMALIGESGPEAVIPLNKLGGGGSNSTFIFNLTGPFMGTPSEARLFAREIKKYIDEETARGTA